MPFCSRSANRRSGLEQETAVINPEPVKGRVDVYESMARSVKYNTGATLRELRKKVVYDKNTNPAQHCQQYP